MLPELLRLLAEIGPGAIWVFTFIAVIVAVFVVYIGIAMRAILRAQDTEQRKVLYQVFRDLLDLFRRGKHK
ncbi:MAG TPA: hypothetical protein VFB30_02880 [Spirochaetia bacterium]|nr:hypothetical protein [Spirochaetia bacterium]